MEVLPLSISDILKIFYTNGGVHVFNQIVNGNNYGTLNQSNGNISSSNTLYITETTNEIDKLIELVKNLDVSGFTAKEDAENCLDDLEMLKEQLNSSQPKKTRIQKALNGIQKFILVMPKTMNGVDQIITAFDNISTKVMEILAHIHG